MTPKEAALRLREWYQAFKNFGKGNEQTVQEFLEVADLLESMSADLDTLRKFTVELSARNEELHKEKLTLALRVKQLVADLEDMTARYKIADDCAKKKGEMNEKLYAEFTAVKAERDAAVADIERTCSTCKNYYYNNDNGCEYDCLSGPDGCHNGNSRWQWRGVTKEE